MLDSTADQVLVGGTTAAGCEQTQQKGHLLGQPPPPCIAGTHEFRILQALSDAFGLLAFLPVKGSQKLVFGICSGNHTRFK